MRRSGAGEYRWAKVSHSEVMSLTAIDPIADGWAIDKQMPISGTKVVSEMRLGQGAKIDYLRPVSFVLVETKISVEPSRCEPNTRVVPSHDGDGRLSGSSTSDFDMD